MNNIFYIEDIGTDEVVLAGKYRPATHWEPEEYDEIYKTVAECLDVKDVFMVQNKDRFHYLTNEDTKVSVEISDEFKDFNLFDIVKRLASGATVSPEEAAAVTSWLEEQSFSCEKDVRDYIAEKGQENYNDERDYYDDDPPDYDVCDRDYDGL